MRAYKPVIGKSERKDRSEDLGANKLIILKRTLRKQVWKIWKDFISLRIRTYGGDCEHGNETLGVLRGKEFD
jgi:hypothetical protein